MSLSPGQILNNRYRIAKLIGQGGFGAVYRAWDTSLNLPCAVKENLDTSAEAQRQFFREATLLASLRHPNLPRVTDHFLIPGQGQYLVMDFIEGQSLADLITSRGRPFTEAEVMPWLNQVCDALAYLHSQNPPIIHRDIKPQNIIITPKGQAMLVDFGISKVYDPALRTSTGGRAVTPGFSPPEQYGGSADRTDARSDVYALGATLFAVLTGAPPPDAIDRLTQGVALPSLAALRPDLSPGLRQLVDGALVLSHTQRPASVADLQKLMSGKVGSVPASYVAPTQRVASSRPGWQDWRLRVGLGGAILLVVVAVVLMAIRNGGGSSAAPTVVARSTTATSAASASPAAVGIASPVASVTSAPVATKTPGPAPMSPSSTAPRLTANPTEILSLTPTHTPSAMAMTETPSSTSTSSTSAQSSGLLIFGTSGAVRELGQPWEQEGVSLNVVKAEIRAGDSGGDAAAHIWFRFFNKTGQKLLVEVDWNDFYMEDSFGNRYVEYYGGGKDAFWVEAGTGYDFDRYYTVRPGERGRVPPTAKSVQVVVRKFSRVKEARWKVNVAGTSTPLSAPDPALVRMPGASWADGGMELVVRDIEIRAGEGGQDAALHVWFSLTNKTGQRALVELDFAHIYAVDSSGQRFIDWDGGGLSSFWLEAGKSFDFDRYYTTACGERSRVAPGAEFVLIVVDHFGPIRNAIWQANIIR